MNLPLITIVIIIILAAIITYYLARPSTIVNSDRVDVKSTLDNRQYPVQNMIGKEYAAYLLSLIYQRILILRDYFENNIDKYPEYRDYIKQFLNRTGNIMLTENSPDGKYTSYTINKGDMIALCLRSKDNNQFHDINLIMYVVLHELAHTACPEIGHTDLFKTIFTFFLKVAIDLKIYSNVNYQQTPMEYCGITITENLVN